jgi:hypothetical protein
MSDDAVVVLVTMDPENNDQNEYRVAYVSDLEKLYGIFDPKTGKWKGDNGIILDLFAENDIYTETDAAIDYAQKVAEDHNEPEFGIVVMKDFHDRYFYEL